MNRSSLSESFSSFFKGRTGKADHESEPKQPETPANGQESEFSPPGTPERTTGGPTEMEQTSGPEGADSIGRNESSKFVSIEEESFTTRLANIAKVQWQRLPHFQKIEEIWRTFEKFGSFSRILSILTHFELKKYKSPTYLGSIYRFEIMIS